MATGFRVSSGADLDTIFTPRTSAKVADVGYRNASGVDLSELFEPYNGISPASNTGFRTSSGTDLAAVFATSPSATIIGGSYFVYYNEPLEGETTATAMISFNANGEVIFNQYDGIGPITYTQLWRSPVLAGVGNGYDIEFIRQTGTGTPTTGRQQLNVARQVSITVTVPISGSSATRDGTYTYNIYDRATNAIVATGDINIQASVGHVA